MHITETAKAYSSYAYVQHVSSLFLYNVIMILICNVKDCFGVLSKSLQKLVQLSMLKGICLSVAVKKRNIIVKYIQMNSEVLFNI